METAKTIFGYIFDPVPGSAFGYYIPMIIIGIALVLGGTTFSYFYNKKRKEDFAFKRLFKKTGSRMVLLGLLILFLIAIRYENIIYFSMRIWLYASLCLLLFFLYRQVKRVAIDYPREKTNMLANIKFGVSQKESNKYLPNKRKK